MDLGGDLGRPEDMARHRQRLRRGEVLQRQRRVKAATPNGGV